MHGSVYPTTTVSAVLAQPPSMDVNRNIGNIDHASKCTDSSLGRYYLNCLSKRAATDFHVVALGDVGIDFMLGGDPVTGKGKSNRSRIAY